MMAVPDEYLRIIQQLIKGTANGKLRWQTGPSRYTFILSSERWSVRLEDVGEIDLTEFRISFLNTSGDKIDEFIVDENDESHADVKYSFGLARRSALNIDQTIKEIEADLDKAIE